MPIIYQANIQDMIERFGIVEITQLEDKHAHTGSTNNFIRTQRALEDAHHEAMAYLHCYELPIPVSPWLIHLICDIARYHLYDVIRMRGSSEFEDHESARRYKDAIEHLKDICKQKLYDIDGNLIPKKILNGFYFEGIKNCLPKNPCCSCCGCDTCSCGGGH